MRIRMIAQDVSDNATTARMSEVNPFVAPDGTHIIAQEGENVRRSWGCVKTTSTIVIKTRTFAVVHVGLAHKYGGGQAWYYFERKTGEPIRRLTARQLSSRRRKQVLEAYRAGKAPSWAKQPFVEKPANGKPQRHVRYKAVAVREGRYFSIFDDSEFVIGTTRREKSEPDHGGGFYVYRSAEMAGKASVPRSSVNLDLERVVLEVEVWGNCEIYGEAFIFGNDERDFPIDTPNPARKEAWTYLKPLKVIS